MTRAKTPYQILKPYVTLATVKGRTGLYYSVLKSDAIKAMKEYAAQQVARNSKTKIENTK